VALISKAPRKKRQESVEATIYTSDLSHRQRAPETHLLSRIPLFDQSNQLIYLHQILPFNLEPGKKKKKFDFQTKDEFQVQWAMGRKPNKQDKQLRSTSGVAKASSPAASI
jgi:hypothetical protein